MFGGAVGDEVTGFGAGFGVVLDDDGVAFVNAAVEDVDEAFHVGHVQADGGFFDEVEVALGVFEAAQALGSGSNETQASSGLCDELL